MLSNKLNLIFTLAAISVWESNAEIVANSRIHETTQFRGIASRVKQMRNISESSMRSRITTLNPQEKFSLEHVAALQRIEANNTKMMKYEFLASLEKFWGDATNLITAEETKEKVNNAKDSVKDANSKKGFVSGVLFLYDPATLKEFKEAGGVGLVFLGVGLVFLSWASLAIGLADDAERMQVIWELADTPGCSDKVLKNGAALTINVLAQGTALASVLTAGPLGAAFGLVSLSVGAAGGKLIDLLPGDCDVWMNKYEAIDKEIKVTSSKPLPKEITLTNDEKEKKITMEDMKKWGENKAKKLKQEVESDDWDVWYNPWYNNPLHWMGFNAQNVTNGKRRKAARHADS